MLLDDTDKQLLNTLQADAHATADTLAETINLSPSQAGRRRQRIEASGIITGYTARLDPAKLGLTVQAFVQVEMASHAPASAAGFARMVAAQRQIVGAWTMTGVADYLLRVWCADLDALNTLVHKVLLAHPSVARVHSQIVMNQLKIDAPLPT
jgi:DNA-binding Lrp family transcriptional regulator